MLLYGVTQPKDPHERRNHTKLIGAPGGVAQGMMDERSEAHSNRAFCVRLEETHLQCLQNL
jgi:hypothetical protein